MRLLASIALMLLLPLSLGCRKKQSSETAGVDTSANISAPMPPETDTATTIADFTFEQRQVYVPPGQVEGWRGE